MVLVAAALVLPPIGHRVIDGPHQARFAVLARDMLQRRVWFGGRIAGEPYRNKPPLYPWAVALLSRVPGEVTAATARTPSALATIGSVAFTFLLGRRLFGRRAALWSALVLLTCFAMFSESQTATPDMLVVLFATVAAYCFSLALDSPPARFAMEAFYAAVALGVFAKGPVGLLPLAIAAVWLWTEQRGAGLRRLWTVPGLAILVGLTVLWLGPYLAAGTDSFARDVVWQDWLDQYLGGPTLQPFGDTIAEWWLGLLPWTPLLPVALLGAVRAWARPAIRFALVWQLVTLIAVLISSTPRARYLLPAYPSAALLIAWWADRHGAAPTRLTRATAWLAAATAAGAASSLFWYPRLYPRVFPPPSWMSVVLALVIAAAGVAMFVGLRSARPRLLIHGVGGATLVLFAAGIWPYDAWVNRQFDYQRLRAIVADGSNREIGAFFNRELYHAYLYAGRPLVPIEDIASFRDFVERPGRPLVLVNRENWRAIERSGAPRASVVARVRLGPDEILAVRLSE